MKERIIELSYNNHEEMFELPLNPEEFEFTEPHNNQRITLLNIGEANLMGHRGLLTGSFSSFFLMTVKEESLSSMAREMLCPILIPITTPCCFLSSGRRAMLYFRAAAGDAIVTVSPFSIISPSQISSAP